MVIARLFLSREEEGSEMSEHSPPQFHSPGTGVFQTVCA